MSVLASLLPGLRYLRAPLAAGFVLLFAAWLVAAPAIPPAATASGVIADLYALARTVGTGPSLAAVAFLAYLVGVLSIRTTHAAQSLANWLTDRVTARITRPALTERLFALTPGAAVRRRRHRAVRHAIMHRLLNRYHRDDQFRTQIGDRITGLHQHAAQHGQRLPAPFAGSTPADLITDLGDRPDIRVDTLYHLIDLPRHAAELTWEIHFVASAAATAPDILDERDRVLAEAEFRLNLALPAAAIVIAFAYRTTPWLLLLLVVPVWLFFLGSEARAEADQVVLDAVMRGTLHWKALDYLDNARIHYRSHSDVTTTPLLGV